MPDIYQQQQNLLAQQQAQARQAIEQAQPTQQQLRTGNISAMLQRQITAQNVQQMQEFLKKADIAQSQLKEAQIQAKIQSPEFQQGAYNEAKRILQSGFGRAGLPSTNSGDVVQDAFNASVKDYYYKIQKGLPRSYAVDKAGNLYTEKVIETPIFKEIPYGITPQSNVKDLLTQGYTPQQIWNASQQFAISPGQKVSDILGRGVTKEQLWGIASQIKLETTTQKQEIPAKTGLFSVSPDVYWGVSNFLTKMDKSLGFQQQPQQQTYFNAQKTDNRTSIAGIIDPLWLKGVEFISKPIESLIPSGSFKEAVTAKKIPFSPTESILYPMFFNPLFVKPALGTEKIITQEPTPKLKIKSIDIIKQGSESKSAGLFRMEIVRPERTATMTSPIEQMFGMKPTEIQISPQQTYFGYTFGLEPKGVQSIDILGKRFSSPILANQGNIEGQAGMVLIRKGASTGKLITLKASQFEITPEEFSGLNPIQKYELQQIAQAKLGRAVPMDYVPQVLGDKFKLFSGNIEAEQIGKVTLSPDSSTFNYFPLDTPKKISKVEQMTISKLFSQSAEGEQVFKSMTGIKDITYPTARATGEIPMIKTISFVSPYKGAGDLKPISDLIIKTSAGEAPAFSMRASSSLLQTSGKESLIAQKSAIETLGKAGAIPFVPKATSSLELVQTDKTLYPLIAGSASALSQITKQASKQAQIEKQITTQILSPVSANALTTEFKTAQTSALSPISFQAQPQLQELITLPEQVSILKPVTQTRQGFASPLVNANQSPAFPMIPELAGASLFKGFGKETKKRKSRAYKLFVKRRGVYLPFSGLLQKNRAIRLGESIARTTLARSFKVIPTKTEILSFGEEKIPYSPEPKIFRSYKIKKGKQIPLQDEWIQRARYSLGSRGEVSEIQMFKRVKRKKFSWI